MKKYATISKINRVSYFSGIFVFINHLEFYKILDFYIFKAIKNIMPSSDLSKLFKLKTYYCSFTHT